MGGNGRSGNCKLFITASGIDDKFLNRFALMMGGRDFGSSPDDHTIDYLDWVVSKGKLSAECGTTLKVPVASSLPRNEYEGSRLAPIEALLHRYVDSSEVGGPFLVLDEQGKRDGTCLVLSHHFPTDDSEEVGYHVKDSVKFMKIRAPWDWVNDIWGNLNIANMDMSDFADPQELTEDGWYTFTGFDRGDVSASFKERNRRLKELERRGKA